MNSYKLRAANLTFSSPNSRSPERHREAFSRILTEMPDELVAYTQTVVSQGLDGLSRALDQIESGLPTDNNKILGLKILSNPSILDGLQARPSVRSQLSKLAAQLPLHSKQKAAPAVSSNRQKHFTPLRYPGGKGKLAPFLKKLIEDNDLLDGEYCEPYAGGAAIGIELLLQEYVSKIHINDISKPLWAFWNSVLTQTEDLTRKIRNTNLTIANWDKQKSVYASPERHSTLDLGFAAFFLNRTNRSGIFNAGVIGGRSQQGEWGIDARFNVGELTKRIESIAAYKDRIQLSREDAIAFLQRKQKDFNSRTLIYLDPPYYQKGKDLYYHFYKHEDHQKVATLVRSIKKSKWIVSYDNVKEIRDLYSNCRGISYGLGYSAHQTKMGSEAMFFSEDLYVSEMTGGMRPQVGGARPHRSIGFQPRDKERRIARLRLGGNT